MSCWRQAALIRWIQSLRNSPLRARRSRYAYCNECMTCSLAARYERLLLPKYPLARSSVARRCFLLWTARLTLAIRCLLRACRAADVSGRLLQAEQALHARLVATGDFRGLVEPPCASAGLVLEHVVHAGLAAHELAGAGLLEALGRAPVGLHLRHVGFVSPQAAGSPPSLSGVSALSALRCASLAAFAFLSGASTIVMLRPSSLGTTSTLATWATRSATLSRMRRPSSGCWVSRPLNMIVTFTLWPSPRTS